jgi:hypothetical protein
LVQVSPGFTTDEIRRLAQQRPGNFFPGMSMVAQKGDNEPQGDTAHPGEGSMLL